MGQETKARAGQVGLRYVRSCDLDRIRKIYETFGKSDFTIRDARARALQDMTSGEILKWSVSGIITSDGQTKWTPTQTPVKIWKLAGNVIKFLDEESV